MRQRKTLSCAKNAIFCARLRSILLKADSLVTYFRFVYDHRTDYSVKQMCHVVKLNRSSFYKWVSTSEKRRLKMHSDGLTSAKVTRKPHESSTAMGLKGLSTRHRCITSRPKPGHRIMPDLADYTNEIDIPGDSARTMTSNAPIAPRPR